MNRRRFFCLLMLTSLLAACSLPLTRPADGEAGAATPTIAPGTAIPLGAEGNPIVLATRPGASPEAVAGAEEVARRLSSLTGLAIVSAPAESYTQLIESLGAGTVHLAWLPPLAYLHAHEQGYADAALVSIVAGQERSASQFLVNAARLVGDKGFRAYFEPGTGTNFAEAGAALAQFKDKRPCWSDAYSLAGYVLPLGILTNNNVTVKPGSFLQGDDAVVAMLYRDISGAVCDFGATTVDGRALVAESDVNAKVVVVWRTEPVIPNDGVAYGTSLPDAFRIPITAGFLAIAGSEDGLALLRTAYGAEGLKFIDDTFYNDLRGYLGFSELDLPNFIR